MFSNQKYTTPEEIAFNRELNHILEQAVAKIPVEYRLVFSLREINGFSITETADALSISASNVKVRLNRAKSMLRQQIEQMYSPEEIFEFKATYCDRMVNRLMNEVATKIN
jgi:RNA polymerase sigma-70 factor (ECF subfamily)